MSIRAEVIHRIDESTRRQCCFVERTLRQRSLSNRVLSEHRIDCFVRELLISEPVCRELRVTQTQATDTTRGSEIAIDNRRERSRCDRSGRSE